MYTATVTGVVVANSIEENEMISTAIRFTWIPGMSPVITPESIPRVNAVMVSM